MNFNLFFVLLFGLNSLAVFLKTLTIQPNHRTYHYITLVINLISHFYYISCYLLMDSPQEYFVLDYGRYMHWILNTELTIVLLTNLAGLSLSNQFILVFFDLCVIVFGFIAEHNIGGSVFYLFMTYSFLAYIPIVYFIYEDFQYGRCVVTSGPAMARQYLVLSLYESIIWLIYPVLWMCYTYNILDLYWTHLGYSVTDIFSKFLFLNYILFYIKPSPQEITGSCDETHTGMP